MRLFAAFTLLALALFWSYPFLAPEIDKTVRSKVAPATRSREPVLVLAPKDVRVPASETVAANLTENSGDPRR